MYHVFTSGDDEFVSTGAEAFVCLQKLMNQGCKNIRVCIEKYDNDSDKLISEESLFSTGSWTS